MVGEITAIICHYRGQIINKCLRKIAHHGIHIIVASSERQTRLGVSWLYFRRNEPTFKRNYSSYYAKTKYIAFLDDDVYLDSRCLNRMCSYLDAHRNVGMVYAVLYRTDNHQVDTAGSWLTPTGFLFESYEKPFKPVRVLAAKSACCMIRKSVFDKVGRFDEDAVIYGEETDLSWRVWHAGYKVMLLPHAWGYHETGKRKDASYYQKKFIHYHGCKNYISMLIKNLNTSRLYIAVINAFIWFCVAVVFLFRNRQASRWIFQGIWYNVVNLPRIWKKRQAIKKTKREDCLIVNPGWRYYRDRLKDYWNNQLHRSTIF